MSSSIPLRIDQPTPFDEQLELLVGAPAKVAITPSGKALEREDFSYQINQLSGVSESPAEKRDVLGVQALPRCAVVSG